MEYDGVTTNKLYPNKIENTLNISLEMKLGIVDDKPILEKKVGKLEGVKEEFYRDAVTHIFGTISSKTQMINFFGFKCVSGKTVFVGYPEGDGFIFGNFGKKFHEIKIQMSLEGILLLQPGFNVNHRTNVYLNTEANNLTKEDLGRDVLIQDEADLLKINDAVQIDKMITVPIIEENHFMSEKLIDDISGNDYKEVVNQSAREWILQTTNTPSKPEEKAILTVDDALKEIEKEKEKSNELKAKINEENEMVAKGRERAKKKNKKKKERAKNGKLHEIKSLVNKKKKTQKKYNGKKEDIKNIKPIDFLKNKENYKKLKEQLSQGIHDELSKLKNDFDSSIAQDLIKNIVPDKNTSIVGKINKRVNKTVSKVKKQMTKEKEKEKKGKEKEKKEKEKEKKKKAKLTVKNMKGEVKKVIEKGDRSKSVQKPKLKTNIIISGDSDDTKENNLFCSDAQQLVEAVESISGSSANITECFTDEKGARMRATKSADPQENWRLFGAKIRRMSGVLLLQTIGCVLKGIRVLNDEIEGRKIITLEERIKLFQLLDENEQIVDFLSQDTGDDEDESTINKNQIGVTQKKEEDDFLIPPENPEKITSLSELETKLAQINKLLDNKNLKPEDKKKNRSIKEFIFTTKKYFNRK